MKATLDRNNLQNDGHVSGLPFVVKVMKIASRGSLIIWLSTVFRKIYSLHIDPSIVQIETPYKVQHDIAVAMDTSEAVLLVPLDMSAAFDTIKW